MGSVVDRGTWTCGATKWLIVKSKKGRNLYVCTMYVVYEYIEESEGRGRHGYKT